MTSLLNRLEGAAPDAILVNAAEAISPDELAESIFARARISPGALGLIKPPYGDLSDPFEPPRALTDLRRFLREEDRHAVILIDGPVAPTVAHGLFGRLRDETFGVPASWVVGAHDGRSGEYLTPPADVFFDEVERIEDLDEAAAEELLSRRGIPRELHDRVRRAVVRAHDGTPRSVLALARGQLRRDPSEAETAIDAFMHATSSLPRGASALLAELQGRGPVTATDHDLQARLGVTDRQLRRDLAALAEGGLVEPLPAGRSTLGRPATTFILTELGRVGG
jgi:DNA-binding transcriptional ArsR family regulator